MYFFNLSPLDFLLWNCSCLEWLCKGLLLHTCIVDFCSDFLETALISAWPKFFIVERARVYCMILEPHCFLTNVQTEQKWWVFGTLFAALLLWILFSYGIAQANGWLCKGLFFEKHQHLFGNHTFVPFGFFILWNCHKLTVPGATLLSYTCSCWTERMSLSNSFYSPSPLDFIILWNCPGRWLAVQGVVFYKRQYLLENIFAALLLWILFYGIASAYNWLCKGLSKHQIFCSFTLLDRHLDVNVTFDRRTNLYSLSL